MKRFMVIVIFVFGLNFSLPAQNSINTDFEPQYRTVLNLDKEIPVKKVSVNIIYNNYRDFKTGDTPTNEKTSLQKTENMANVLKNDLNLSMVWDIIEGPESTLYINDFENKRIVQISKEGKFIKSYGKMGDLPGEFKRDINQIINIENKYIYVNDDFTRRVQIFDLNMNYLNSIYNPALFGRLSYGKDSNLYCFPKERVACPVPEKYRSKGEGKKIIKTMFISDVYDMLGKEVRRIGKIRNNDSVVFQDGNWSFYKIFTNINSDYIWCVFELAPVIRKYDYDGNFIEEIILESEEINKIDNKKILNDEKIAELEKSKSSDNKGSQKNIKSNAGRILAGGKIILSGASLLPNGDLVIKALNHGNIQISGNKTPAKIIQKYEFTNISEAIKWYARDLKICILHNKLFAYDRQVIMCEE
jgi:hypothetical protein